MKTLAVLALVAALGLSACDAGETFPTDGNPADMRGAAGAAGMSGAGGAGGAAYTPDPAVRCVDPGTPMQLVICDYGGGSILPNGTTALVPMYNTNGTQCYYCPDLVVPDAGCAIHIPAAISGGQVIRPEHDIFCAPNTCDPSLCHPKS